MNCDRYREQMSDLLDGHLDPAGEKSLRDHMSGCERCRTDFEDLERATKLVRGLRSVEPPPDLLPQIRRRLDAEERRRERSFWVILQFPQTRVALAAAALLLIAFYGYRYALPSAHPRVAPQPTVSREAAHWKAVPAKDAKPAASAVAGPMVPAPREETAAAVTLKPERPASVVTTPAETRSLRGKEVAEPRNAAAGGAADRIWREPRPAVDEFAATEETVRRSRNLAAATPPAAPPAVTPAPPPPALSVAAVRQEGAKAEEQEKMRAGAARNAVEPEKVADLAAAPVPTAKKGALPAAGFDARSQPVGTVGAGTRATRAPAPVTAPGAFADTDALSEASALDKAAKADPAGRKRDFKVPSFQYAGKPAPLPDAAEVTLVVATRDAAAVRQVLRPYLKEKDTEGKAKAAAGVVHELERKDAAQTEWITAVVPTTNYVAILAKLQALGTVTIETGAAAATVPPAAASVAAQAAAEVKADAAAESVTVRARVLSQ